VNPILDAFSKQGAAFVRPVQVLPTVLEIHAELLERVRTDKIEREQRSALLAECFPDVFKNQSKDLAELLSL